MALYNYKAIKKLLQTWPHTVVDLCRSLSTDLWGFVFKKELKLKNPSNKQNLVTLLWTEWLTLEGFPTLSNGGVLFYQFKNPSMKKLLPIAFAIAVFVPLTSFAALDQNLKYGSTGPAVKEMQEFLIDQGCNITPTGNFYALTLKCVKSFQSAQGITPVSGFWGPITRAKASSLLDLSVSDQDEATQTGTITAPIVVTPVNPVINNQTSAVIQPPETIPASITQDALGQLYSSFTPIDSSLPCQTQIQDLKNEINLLRQTAAKEEYSLGYSSKEAEKVGAQEDQDEAPLDTQLRAIPDCPAYSPQ